MNNNHTPIDHFKDLEPQQYSNMYFESDVPLADVRKNALRVLIYGSLLIVGMLLFLSFMIHFPTEINVPVIIKNEGKEEVIRFPYNVYVDQKFVKVNDMVKKGDPLISIGAPQITNLIQQIEKGKVNLDLQNTSEAQVFQDQVNLLRSETTILENEIDAIQKEINDLKDQRNTECDALQNVYLSNLKIYKVKKQAYEAGAIAKIDYQTAEKEKVHAFDALQTKMRSYKTLINTKASEIEVIQSKINRKNKEIQTIRSEYNSAYQIVDTDLKLAENQLAYNFGDYTVVDGKLTLVAEKSGKVAYLFEGERELKSGQILLKIRNDLRAYYAQGEVPPQAIGKFKEGQKAALKITSFPHFEWGVMEGEVAVLSKSPNENGNFLMRLDINNYGNLKPLVQLGMDGMATILIEEKSFASHVTHTLKRSYYNSTELPSEVEQENN